MPRTAIPMLVLAASLALSAAGLAQAQERPAPCTPIAASGTVAKPGGGLVSFAVVAGCADARFWGSVSFTDREADYRVSSTDITGYLWDPTHPEVREVCGRALTGRREEVMFRARLVDGGDGGRGEFGFATDNTHTAGSRFYILKALPLSAGDVRVQRSQRADPDPVLARIGVFRMCGDLNSPR